MEQLLHAKNLHTLLNNNDYNNNKSYNTYCVPGTMLSILHMFNIILTKSYKVGAIFTCVSCMKLLLPFVCEKLKVR